MGHSLKRPTEPTSSIKMVWAHRWAITTTTATWIGLSPRSIPSMSWILPLKEGKDYSATDSIETAVQGSLKTSAERRESKTAVGRGAAALPISITTAISISCTSTAGPTIKIKILHWIEHGISVQPAMARSKKMVWKSVLAMSRKEGASSVLMRIETAILIW